FTDESRKVFAMEFVPPVTGAYHFEMRENQFLAKDYDAELRVVQDPAPVVQLHRPSSSMDVVANADIFFQMSIEDEMFPGNAAGAGAIRSVYLEYRRKNAEGQWLDAQPLRVPLYEHQAIGSLLPRASAILARSLWVAPDVRLRAPKLDVVYHWPLKNRFKDG